MSTVLVLVSVKARSIIDSKYFSILYFSPLCVCMCVFDVVLYVGMCVCLGGGRNE